MTAISYATYAQTAAVDAKAETALQERAVSFILRNEANAETAAAYPDGTIVTLAGQPCVVNSLLTGTASATSDLSVDGLGIFGGKVCVWAHGFDRAAIEAALSASDGITLDFGDGFSYTSDGPILIGSENGRANPKVIQGKSRITFTYEQPDNSGGFGNPERKLSGLHCLVSPVNNLTIDVRDLDLTYTGTFDQGTNNGRVNGLFMYGYAGGEVARLKASGFNACGAFVGGSGARSGGGNYDTEDTRNIKFSKCDLSQNRVAGLEIAHTSNFKASQNELNENGKAGDTGTGYGFAAQSGTTNSGTSVTDNTCNGNHRKGIDFHAGKSPRVVNNLCLANKIYGISVSTRCYGAVKVLGNEVGEMVATAALGVPCYGIFVGQDILFGGGMRATLANNSVDGTQEAGENFYPFWLRGGGLNRFALTDNAADCGDITHFAGADNAGSNAESDISIRGCNFNADDVTSFHFRLYEENLVGLDFVENQISDGTAYGFEAVVQLEAGTPPASAGAAIRKVTGNQFFALTAANLQQYFSGSAFEASNFVQGEQFLQRPEYTISGGAVTIYRFDEAVLLDTEGDTATDDLDTITATSDRHRVLIRAASSSRTVVLKDGTGNLALNGDFSLTQGNDLIELIYNEGNGSWAELSRSDNQL